MADVGVEDVREGAVILVGELAAGKDGIKLKDHDVETACDVIFIVDQAVQVTRIPDALHNVSRKDFGKGTTLAIINSVARTSVSAQKTVGHHSQTQPSHYDSVQDVFGLTERHNGYAHKQPTSSSASIDLRSKKSSEALIDFSDTESHEGVEAHVEADTPS